MPMLRYSRLPFLQPHRRSPRTMLNPLSASEVRAVVVVYLKYLQRLGTWNRGHVGQKSGALGEGVNRISDLGSKSTIDLVAECCGHCNRAYFCWGSRIRPWPLEALRSQRSMQSIERRLEMYDIA